MIFLHTRASQYTVIISLFNSLLTYDVIICSMLALAEICIYMDSFIDKLFEINHSPPVI